MADCTGFGAENLCFQPFKKVQLGKQLLWWAKCI
jgi:hypothetical protein